MKVICIDDNWRPAPGQNGCPTPRFGEICEVRNSAIINEALYYQLLGRFNIDSGFIADNFSPLSFKDETEFVRNYNKQKV